MKIVRAVIYISGIVSALAVTLVASNAIPLLLDLVTMPIRGGAP